MGREPVEEHRGLDDLLAGEFPAGRSDRLIRGAGPKSGQDFPGGEPLDELGAIGVSDRVEVGEKPTFEQADLFVGARQDAAGHEQLTQMRGCSPGLQGVKRLVGQRDLSSTELAHQRFGRFGFALAGVEPGQDRQRAFGGEQGMRQWCKFSSDLARVVAEELAQPITEGAACAQPAPVQLAFLWAAAASKRRGESRAVRADRCLIADAQTGQNTVGSASSTAPSNA